MNKKVYPVEDVVALGGALYIFEKMHGIRDGAALSFDARAAAYAMIADSEHPQLIATKIAQALINHVPDAQFDRATVSLLSTVCILIGHFQIADEQLIEKVIHKCNVNIRV